jgi:proteic killer suppression protein
MRIQIGRVWLPDDKKDAQPASFLLTNCDIMCHTVFSREERAMIQSFKHKGLEKFFTSGSKKGIQPEHAKKLSLILAALNAATAVNQMDIDGWNLHPLKHWGDDLWSVKVNGNWRVVFRFVAGNAELVDYLDYH